MGVGEHRQRATGEVWGNKGRKEYVMDPTTARLLDACKKAAWLYDQLAMGPLDAAVKYGPDYMPPTDEQCLEIRQALHDAIIEAEGR